MPFCPNCRYEYKEGIRECPDCGACLVQELPQEEATQTGLRKTAKSPHFVPLRNLPSRLYAQMLEEALRNEGIPSMTKGDAAFPFRTATNHIPVAEVTIWVPEKDLEKARELADWMFDHI